MPSTLDKPEQYVYLYDTWCKLWTFVLYNKLRFKVQRFHKVLEIYILATSQMSCLMEHAIFWFEKKKIFLQQQIRTKQTMTFWPRCTFQMVLMRISIYFIADSGSFDHVMLHDREFIAPGEHKHHFSGQWSCKEFIWFQWGRMLALPCWLVLSLAGRYCTKHPSAVTISCRRLFPSVSKYCKSFTEILMTPIVYTLLTVSSIST